MNAQRTPEENRIIAEADRQIAVYVDVIRKVQAERDALRECAEWIVTQWERGNLICHTPNSDALVRLRKLLRPEQGL